jgi:hypothetical protein
VERAAAVDVLTRLHLAQNEYYGGGDDAALRLVLANEIVWTVPGASAIAGTYRGIDDVLRYFERRRAIASSTFQLQRLDVLVGEHSRVAALVDGRATIGGIERIWSTVGLYDIIDNQISACWLLPLDPSEFDAVWS